jgi:hypothetical protein
LQFRIVHPLVRPFGQCGSWLCVCAIEIYIYIRAWLGTDVIILKYFRLF